MKFNWFRRQRRNEDLDAEIRHHLDEAIHDRIARGEGPDEARACALRKFGNVRLVYSSLQMNASCRPLPERCSTGSVSDPGFDKGVL